LKNRIPYLVFLILGLVYLLFPTNNANIDSWYYAACVKHHQELINSHHLLYNSIGRAWYLFIRLLHHETEAIDALNMMNAIAGSACLVIFYHILLALKQAKKSAMWMSLFCGVSFGFMRYATDAETYILPLFFSLLSTYFFISEKTRFNLFWSALFSVIAILVHQLHIWWAMAMVISLLMQRPFKLNSFLLFCLPFIMVPTIYYLIYVWLDLPTASFWQFISGEYSKGNASLSFSAKSLLLTLINFIRSFIQVHGMIPYLLNKNPLAYAVLFSVLLSAFIYCYKTGKFAFKIHRTKNSHYSQCFFLAFTFHLIFAFLSSGNAEFMVMLPFLLVLYLVSAYDIESYHPFIPLTLIIFAWNMAMAIIPSGINNLNRVDRQVDWTIQHPGAYFLWQHKPLIENVITYQQGFGKNHNFISLNKKNQGLLDSLVNKQIPVYTDRANPGTRFSREEIVNNDNYISGRYLSLPQGTWENVYGTNQIYLISKKGD